MRLFLALALVGLSLIVVAIPSASAWGTCVGTNPYDGQCEVRFDFFASSPFSWCTDLLVNPPVPGLYYYTATCTPNVCGYPEINCHP